MEDILRRLQAEANAYRTAAEALEEAIENIKRAHLAMHEAGHATTSQIATPARPGHAPPPSDRVLPFYHANELNQADTQVMGAVDLSRASIKSVAALVLQGADKRWMHFKDIAAKAIEVGYRSDKHGDDLEKVALSFRDTMRRDTKAFQRSGPKFRLQPNYQPQIVEKPDPNRITLADRAAEIMARVASPPTMRTIEIVNALIETGEVKFNNRESFYNSVYSALDRDKRRFEKAGPGSWRLNVRSTEHALANGAPRT
jgi:hypothetical protein